MRSARLITFRKWSHDIIFLGVFFYFLNFCYMRWFACCGVLQVKSNIPLNTRQKGWLHLYPSEMLNVTLWGLIIKSRREGSRWSGAAGRRIKVAEANSALTFISHKNRACTMLQSDGFTITGGKKERKTGGGGGGGGVEKQLFRSVWPLVWIWMNDERRVHAHVWAWARATKLCTNILQCSASFAQDPPDTRTRSDMLLKTSLKSRLQRHASHTRKKKKEESNASVVRTDNRRRIHARPSACGANNRNL